MGKLITQSRFAKLMRVHRSTVSKWVDRGLITLTADKRIDPTKAKEELKKNRDEAKRIEYELRSRQDRAVEYAVLKPFIENIDGEDFLVPEGSTICVARDGSVAFFPPKL